MSDRERFIEFIASVGFAEEEWSGRSIVGDWKYQTNDVEDGGKEVLLGNAGEGYSCFFSRWMFDDAGKLLTVGHFE